MNAWTRVLGIVLGALTALLAVPVLAFAAPVSATAPAAHLQAADIVPNFPSTSDRCVNSSHTIPCWALTFHAGQGNQGCPNGVPFFLRNDGKTCIGGNDLVLISCFFHGSPIVGGDNYQDHVIAENAGGRTDTGHIPDFYIDLNNHNPDHLQFRPNIPPC